MKLKVITAIVIIILSAGVPRIAPAGETVKLAIGEWPPYTSQYDPDSKILERIVTEAFRLEGIEVKYDYFPWKRSYIYARDGDYDGTFPWQKDREREDTFYINSIPLVSDVSVFFHLRSRSFDWRNIEDLKKYRVGVTIGYTQEKFYRDKGIKVEAVPKEELNFYKLLAGRIDVYQASRLVGYSMINKLFEPEKAKLFTHHPKIVHRNELYILFSKASPGGKKFKERFDSGLKKLKASGAYDRIISGK